MTRPSAPSQIASTTTAFMLWGRSSFDRGAPVVPATKVAAEHQSVERWIVDAAANVSARQ